MAATVVGPVDSSQLVGGAANALTLTPQATEPTTNASAAQIYAKTDKNLYHKDISGAVTNLLSAQQLAASALAGTTTTWPYGAFNSTGPLFLQSGASQNIYKGYIARGAGSVIGASWMGAANGNYTGTVQVYKNGSLWFTALTGCNFVSGGGTVGPVTASFLAGAYPYVQNDYFDAYYSGTGTALYMGVGLTFTEGNAYANFISTALSANTTVAASDNQRAWVASAATQYVLTLPATSATQDFHVRVVVTGGAGVKIQAPAGVTLYNGSSVSSSGGTLTATAAGAYAALYNPAGTSLWTMTNPSALWAAA